MLGERIKELRLTHDMSQEDLSEVLDVSRQSISKYENGTAEPSLDKLKLIVDYFEVSYDYLLSDAPAEKPVKTQTKPKSAPAPEKIKRSISHLTQSKEAEHLPSIDIQIKTGDRETLSFFKFEVVEKFPHMDYKPSGLLIGVDEMSIFGDHKVNIAWYRHLEDAEKEKQAILAAIEAGEESYEIQYDVPVKKRGFFSVQLDETRM